MREIQSKIKALGWSQDYSLIFKLSRAANSVVGGGILTKFKLNQAFIAFLVTCKNEEDSSKNKGTRVVTLFSHNKSIGIFLNARRQLTS